MRACTSYVFSYGLFIAQSLLRFVWFDKQMWGMFSKSILEQSDKQLLKQNYKKQNELNNKNKKRRFSSMEVQTWGLKRKNKLGSKGINQV